MTSRGRTITEHDVVAFAALTGDWHPQHTDEQWASDSSFGERVAHGMLLLSYAVGLVDVDPARIVALRRVSDVVFKRPVRIGDTIHVEATLARPDDGRGLEAYEWRIVNQHERLVARAMLEVVVRGQEVEPEPAAADGTPLLV
jgi:3-hydroxybutyryl-CoA dehydratase